MIDQERVALHLFVIAHAEFAVVRCKIAPIASLPQEQQPIVAQAVFLVRARIAA